MKLSRVQSWVVWLGVFSFPFWAGAQEEPADLKAMRAQYEDALQESVLPVMRSYGLALRRKMTEFTQAGKLDEALAFKKEMEAVAAALTRAAAVEPSVPEAPKPGAAGWKTIDFLEIIDTELDGKPAKKWLLEEGVLMCVEGNFVPKLILPYEPPEEYNFTVTFEQPRMRNGVSLIMPNGSGRVFNITAGDMGGDRLGIGIGGKNENEFAKMKAGQFKADREYTLTAEVRKEAIVAKIDGREVFRYDGSRDVLACSVWLNTRVPNQLAVTADDPALISKIEVVEITGTGKMLREK